MGFFSKVGGLLGIGSSGGGGTSTATTSNNVDVQPVTNLNIDFKELAKVLEQGNNNDILTEAQKLELSKEALKIETANESIKTTLEAEKNDILNNFFSGLGSFFPLITVSIIYLVFFKKGKDNKNDK